MSPELTIDLFRAHAGFARRLARSLLRDEDAADDVSQEAWRVALERGPAGIGDFRTWLGGVVRNLARMHLRGEAARRRREAQRAARETAAPAQTAARLEQVELLVAALKRLREPFRSVVLLRYAEDLPPREIARRTGVGLDTVKSRLKRGLALLRADLDATHDGDDRAWRAGLAALLAVPGRRTAAAGLAVAAAAALGAGAWLLTWRGGTAPTAPLAPAPQATVVRGASLTPPVSLVRVPAAQPADAAAARGRVLRLVDAATGEPIPDFVVVSPALDPPVRVSDGTGALALEGTDAVVELQLIDDARLPRDEPEPVELAGEVLKVKVGPTYHLTLAPPPRPEDVLQARLASPDPRREHRTSFAPVRGDDAPWVRFGARAAGLGGGPPWRLEVRSDDGFRFGHAEVAAAVGVQPGRVFVEMRQTGRVDGRAVGADGAGIDQAELELRGAGGVYAAASDATGRFGLAWVPPGRYELVARSRRHLPARTTVDVTAGAAVAARLELSMRPAGSIAGRLRSAAGQAAAVGPVTLVLTDRADPERTFLQTLALPGFGAFRFDGVPEAEYELTVRAPDFARWRPARLRVSPTRDDLELWCRDDEPHGDLVLRAVDAATGAALATFEAFVQLPGEPESGKVLAAADGRLRLRNVPGDARLRFVVRAQGYAAVAGDRRAAADPVPLRRGWGNRCRVRGRDGRPVAGVRLVAGGVTTAPSGADGVLDLYLSEPPGRLTVAPGRYRLAGGDVFRDGSFDDLLWGIAVVVAPSDPEEKR